MAVGHCRPVFAIFAIPAIPSTDSRNILSLSLRKWPFKASKNTQSNITQMLKFSCNPSDKANHTKYPTSFRVAPTDRLFTVGSFLFV